MLVLGLATRVLRDLSPWVQVSDHSHAIMWHCSESIIYLKCSLVVCDYSAIELAQSVTNRTVY